MSAKEELRAFIEDLTPAQLEKILRRLPQINAELTAYGLPQIAAAETEQTKAEPWHILADDRRPA